MPQPPAERMLLTLCALAPLLAAFLLVVVLPFFTHSIPLIPPWRLLDLAVEPGKWPKTCFAVAMRWFAEIGPLLRLSAPFGLRTFVLIADADALVHVLVTKSGRFGKRHAHGVLEQFRRTTLSDAGCEAWPIVHKLAAQLAGDLLQDRAFSARLIALVRGGIAEAMPPTGAETAELARPLRAVWWRVVLLVVLGRDDAACAALYEDAWCACIERLDTPAVFLFRLAQVAHPPTSLTALLPPPPPTTTTTTPTTEGYRPGNRVHGQR